MPHVKIKVQPKQTIEMPNLCVSCAQKGVTTMRIRKRQGMVIRSLDVPLCHECAQVVASYAPSELFWHRAHWPLVLVVLVGGIWFLDRSLGWPLVGWIYWPLLFGGGVAMARLASNLMRWAQQWSRSSAKRAIEEAAQIETFSWRATTFVWTNGLFAKRFKAMNEERLFQPAAHSE
ncbi:MAG TPA: hypothetical protein VLL52_11310 [Anaerolineae bacterium]|nr:hypothetical protein [Anaerolineae bacterium]